MLSILTYRAASNGRAADGKFTRPQKSIKDMLIDSAAVGLIGMFSTLAATSTFDARAAVVSFGLAFAVQFAWERGIKRAGAL